MRTRMKGSHEHHVSTVSSGASERRRSCCRVGKPEADRSARGKQGDRPVDPVVAAMAVIEVGRGTVERQRRRRARRSDVLALAAVVVFLVVFWGAVAFVLARVLG